MKIKDIMAIVAVALMTVGCSSRDEVQSEEELVPILLAASIDDSPIGMTRAATDPTEVYIQNTEFREGETVSLYIKEKGGGWIANAQNSYVVGENGFLSVSSNAYYPMDGTPVEIYGIHPNGNNVGASFTVKTDQTLADNYAYSDLCYSKTAEYTRKTTRQVVNFKHVLSKIIITVDATGAGGGAVTNLRLRAKTSIPFDYPVENSVGYTLGTATTLNTITLNSAAATTGAAAIIPPQTTAAGEMRISFDLAGVGPIAYDFPAGVEFASNTQYRYKVIVGSSITVTSSISAWGSGVDNDKTVEIGRPKLPIEYCCEYNMGAPSAEPMTMASTHLKTNTYFYNEATSLSYFNKHVTISEMSGTYHLPSIQEMRTLVPYYSLSFSPASETIVQTGKGEQLQWGKYKKNDTYAVPLQTFYNEFATSPDYCSAAEKVCYAIRLKASDIAGPQGYGPYTCAYRYTFVVNDSEHGDNQTLHIKVRYLGTYSTIELGDITNASFWNESGVEYIERVFPCFGYYATQDPSHPWYSEDMGYYRSATLQGTYSTYNNYHTMAFTSSSIGATDTNWANTQYATAIRLFKDAE